MTQGTQLEDARQAGAEVICCEAVKKDFVAGTQTVRALRGVDLSIRSGELTLLVGPSGCGKTTLLSVIAGILTPTNGRVITLGKPLAELTSRQRAKMRLSSIGFVFQHFNLVPTLSVAENVALPLLLAKASRKNALAAAERQLDLLGLSESYASLPGQLSGGQQQRVAFARAMVSNPRLIVCDEPTSALDAATGKSVMQTLRETSLRPDRAVVVVTHDPRVYPFGDCIITMEDGVIQGDEKNLLQSTEP